MGTLGAAMNGGNSEAYTIPAQIGGKEYTLSDTFDVISPSTDKVLHRCSSASVQEATKAVEAAHAAFPAWRDTLPNQKRDIFLKAADIMDSRAVELGKYMEDETGGSNFWSETFNVGLSANMLRDIAGRISTLSGSLPVMGDSGRSAMVLKVPYGVILGIAPWNAAYILGTRAVAYAIAAGNTAILKASELSPRCSWAIVDCFREAGLPDGVLNCIAHKPSDAVAITKTLIEDPRVKKINFTGSTNVGKIISEMAGRLLKPVLLELGGKAPAIVWADADLKLAAQQCAVGAFLHSGQICMATERVLVHKDVAVKFEVEFKAAVQAGWTEASVLINRAAVEKNKRLLKDAVRKGATLLNGSIDTKESSKTRMAPIVIKDVTPGMDLYQTESFGATVSVIVFETEEEALQIANDTEYGLAAAVFTSDLRRGLRMAKSIESGAVHINSMTVHDEAALPHGGMKSSGYGRFGAIGMEDWVRTQTITYDV